MIISDTTTDADLDAAQAALDQRRADARAKIDRATKIQKLTDMAAIADLEDLHGATNVSVMEIPLEAGLPVLAAVRTPTDAEIKKYRYDLKPKTERDKPDTAKAAENVGTCALIYPDAATFDQMCEKRPGLRVQIGVAAIALSTASADAAGKE